MWVDMAHLCKGVADEGIGAKDLSALREKIADFLFTPEFVNSPSVRNSKTLTGVPASC